MSEIESTLIAVGIFCSIALVCFVGPILLCIYASKKEEKKELELKYSQLPHIPPPVTYQNQRKSDLLNPYP